MINIHTLTQSRLFRELSGGLLGMTVAIVVYVAVSGMSSSSMKGLIVSSSQLSTNGAVSVNDKTVEADTLRRLASRAAQIALQKNQVPASTSSSSASVLSSSKSVGTVVADHADRTAWIAMRQTQRDRASAYDLAKNAAAPIVPPAETAPPRATASAPATSLPPVLFTPPASEQSLPDSGPMLNVSLCIAFGLTCLRKRSAIAALIRAS